MRILQYLLMFVEVVCCMLLVGVVLLQRSKKEGMGVAFGAGVSETIFGSRASNVLVKITVVLGSIFLANTLVLALIEMKTISRRPSDSIMSKAARPAVPLRTGKAPRSAPKATPGSDARQPAAGAATEQAPAPPAGGAAAPVAPPVEIPPPPPVAPTPDAAK